MEQIQPLPYGYKKSTRQTVAGYLPHFSHRLAERQGFEPQEPLGSTVFKTAAIDHSAISPGAKVIRIFLFSKSYPPFLHNSLNLNPYSGSFQVDFFFDFYPYFFAFFKINSLYLRRNELYPN